MTAMIDRAFVRIGEGLVHYRHTGPASGKPLVMLHASPGSSRGLEPLMAAIAAAMPARRIIAPDTLGNGDSVEPCEAEPDISYFSDTVARTMSALSIETADIYGTHTGARTACELSIQQPDRVQRVVIDGIGDYDDDMRALLLREYAPAIQPDEYGRHLIWAFNFVRDMSLHYPYFMRDVEHRLMNRSVPDAEELHTKVLEVLKGITSYHKPYRAAFAYRATERLPLVRAETVLLDSVAELPTLRAKVAAFADSMPNGKVLPVEPSLESKAAAMAVFLA